MVNRSSFWTPSWRQTKEVLSQRRSGCEFERAVLTCSGVSMSAGLVSHRGSQTAAIPMRLKAYSFLPVFYQTLQRVLPLDASSTAALHESFDFLERGVIEIAVDRVLQAGCGGGK